MKHPLLIILAVFFPAMGAQATLVVNSAMPITERVTVQIIQVATDAGTTPAPAFGDASQQALIFSAIDTIWAQAGIDIDFNIDVTAWNNTFALTGTPGDNDPRSTDDLETIVDSAALAGVDAANPDTINLFLVRIVPGFSQTSNNTSNGLAFLDSNGITLWAGPNLLSFTNGRDVIASVLAHEIGHNLGLDHIVEAQNLMQGGGSPDDGERLNATQISTALASSFSVPIPEPATLMLAGLGLFYLGANALRKKFAPPVPYDAFPVPSWKRRITAKRSADFQ
jgi:hypothetical protein